MTDFDIDYAREPIEPVVGKHVPAGAETDFERAVWDAINTKSKPVGALGRLESLAAQVALVQQTLEPTAERCKLTVFAADHGIAEAGVSAYPREVTRQMLLNFLAGGAAANVMAHALDAGFVLVDAGVKGPEVRHPRLVSQRIGDGTHNAVEQPAMSADQCSHALRAGQAIGREGTHEVACFGEMGIGNTSSASLVAAKVNYPDSVQGAIRFSHRKISPRSLCAGTVDRRGDFGKFYDSRRQRASREPARLGQ